MSARRPHGWRSAARALKTWAWSIHRSVGARLGGVALTDASDPPDPPDPPDPADAPEPRSGLLLLGGGALLWALSRLRQSKLSCGA